MKKFFILNLILSFVVICCFTANAEWSYSQNIKRGKGRLAEVVGNEEFYGDIAFAGNNKLYFFTYDFNLSRLIEWELNTGDIRILRTAPKFGIMDDLAVPDDDPSYIVYDEGNRIIVQSIVKDNLEPNYSLTLWDGANKIDDIAISPDGKILAAAKWSTSSSGRIWSFKDRKHSRIEFIPSSDTIAITASNYSVFTNKRTPYPTRPVIRHYPFDTSDAFVKKQSSFYKKAFEKITALSYGNGPSRKPYVASGHQNGDVLIWSSAGGPVIRELHGSATQIYALDFTHDGKYLAAGSGTGAYIWNVETGKRVFTTQSDSSVRAVAFSPNDTLAVRKGNQIQIFKRRGAAAPSTNLVGEPSEARPAETVLLTNYPNPFNPETWIPYQLAEPAGVTVAIRAADGQLVRTLSLGHQAAGVYRSKSRAAYWDGRNNAGERVASGVYFYTLTAGNFSATGKMLIRK